MLFSVHNLFGALFASIVALVLFTGWVPATAPRGTVPESVRANPASYRPVYVPLVRGSSTSGSGDWSGGK